MSCRWKQSLTAAARAVHGVAAARVRRPASCTAISRCLLLRASAQTCQARTRSGRGVRQSPLLRRRSTRATAQEKVRRAADQDANRENFQRTQRPAARSDLLRRPQPCATGATGATGLPPARLRPADSLEIVNDELEYPFRCKMCGELVSEQVRAGVKHAAGAPHPCRLLRPGARERANLVHAAAPGLAPPCARRRTMGWATSCATPASPRAQPWRPTRTTPTASTAGAPSGLGGLTSQARSGLPCSCLAHA